MSDTPETDALHRSLVNRTELLIHRDTQVPAVYWEWDGVMSMDGRGWHACPVCGIGVCSPWETPMAHKECMDAYRDRIESKGN